jgi:hypothetical protein
MVDLLGIDDLIEHVLRAWKVFKLPADLMMMFEASR